MNRNEEKRLAHAESLLAHDREFTCGGTLAVAGIDEAGRGPLVGNVVAACVIMPNTPVFPWIDDSKKLSESRREEMYQLIVDNAVYVGVGQASAEEIDTINILEATKKAMARAAEKCTTDIFLIDAVKNVGLSSMEVPIIKGDAKSYNIAAASIVAKVTRDRQLRQMNLAHPEYGFARNKGYGTPEHIAALKKYGPIDEHRISFIGNFCTVEQISRIKRNKP